MYKPCEAGGEVWNAGYLIFNIVGGTIIPVIMNVELVYM